MMAKHEPDKLRTVGLVGHGGSGKTTLAERLLNACGMTKRLGRIEEGNTVGDYMPDEIGRGHTICLSLMHLDRDGCRIHIVDNPGYADFIGEVAASIRVVDSVIVVVDGAAGAEVGTDNCWRYADENNLPRLVMINKLDKDNTDFYRVLEELGTGYGVQCIPLTLPVGKGDSFSGVIDLVKAEEGGVEAELKDQFDKYREKVVEAAAEGDDVLLEKYLEEGALSPEEVVSGLRKAVIAGNVVPVVCGSAEKGIGLDEMLDAVASFLPSPTERPELEATGADGGAVAVKFSEDGPLVGLTFKVLNDPYVGNLTFFRVLSGTLASDTQFYNATKRSGERIGQLFFLQGKEQVPVATLGPGDLAAVAKLKNTSVGDTICTQRAPMSLPPIQFPASMVRRAILPKTRADEDKIASALRRIAEEDPTFSQTRDEQTKEMVIAGRGDLHLDIIMDRLKQRFSVEAETRPPTIAYKETIKSSTKIQGKYKRQSGGRGQYGDVWLEVGPLPRGEGFEFIDKIVGGAVPKNYIPAVEKGVYEAMERGVLAGYPVVDVRVTLYDGTYHTVDSSDMAFKIAGSMALQKAVQAVQHCLLEPVVEAEITVPEEYMGDVTGDLNGRRGRILGMDSGPGGKQIIRVTVPEAEMLRYSTELRSMTGGRGSYTMKFLQYDEVPDRIAQKITAEAAEQKEKKER
jgi:elongation factor G